jgi:hypothetical protein
VISAWPRRLRDRTNPGQPIPSTARTPAEGCNDPTKWGVIFAPRGYRGLRQKHLVQFRGLIDKPHLPVQLDEQRRRRVDEQRRRRAFLLALKSVIMPEGLRDVSLCFLCSDGLSIAERKRGRRWTDTRTQLVRTDQSFITDPLTFRSRLARGRTGTGSPPSTPRAASRASW